MIENRKVASKIMDEKYDKLKENIRALETKCALYEVENEELVLKSEQIEKEKTKLRMPLKKQII